MIEVTSQDANGIPRNGSQPIGLAAATLVVIILGIGSIKKRPVVINDAIAIRSIAYMTLSFDHRIVDGALGGSFLSAVIKHLENVDENLVV